ncbi:interferon regulatory factor [Plakobranchus ocellatus]|uniref:Interferon regulatory factor n=1 Tax=Plakobranchus ocellatus TaxID=259542 RepID=A0AAV3YZ95_9GAST|nr:interferon regulatory factor [Plakobranchus ocellatus]
MDEPKKPKRMRNFVLEQLKLGSCPGVCWINERDGIFKVPWHKIKSIERKDIPIKFKIFVEWAKHTGKIKEDEEPNYSKFKTQFRTALTRLNDFEELHNELLKTEEPCKVYKFTDWHWPGCPVSSPDSTSHAPEAGTCHEVQSQSMLLLQENGPNHQMFRTCITGILQTQDLSRNELPVPDTSTVRQTELQPSQTLIAGELCNNFSSPSPVTDILQQALLQTNIPLEMGSVMNPQIIEGSFPDDELSGVMEWISPESSKSNTTSKPFPEFCHSLEQNAEASLPSDLKSIDDDDLVPPGVFTVKRDVEQNTQCSSVYMPDEKATSQNTSQKPGEAEHKMLMLLYYGHPKKQVMERTIGAKGCRLFFGDGKKGFEDTICEEDMFGSSTVEDLPMPPMTESISTHTKIKDFVTKTLDGMNRGIILTFKNGDIYANRLCYSKIYVCDADFNSRLLDRKDSSPQKVFDFKKFSNSLQKGGPKEAPYFILTFAKEVKKDSKIHHPLDKIHVLAYVYHELARSLDSDVNIDYLVSSEPEMSELNTMDRIQKNFKDMKMK